MLHQRTYNIYSDRNMWIFESPELFKKTMISLNEDPLITGAWLSSYFIGSRVRFEFDTEKVGDKVLYFTYLLRAYLEQIYSVSMPPIPAQYNFDFFDAANDPMLDAVYKNKNRSNLTRKDWGLIWTKDDRGQTIITHKKKLITGANLIIQG